MSGLPAELSAGSLNCDCCAPDRLFGSAGAPPLLMKGPMPDVC